MKRLLTWLVLEKSDKLVAILSLGPSLGPYGIEWPSMRIDSRIGQHMSVTSSGTAHVSRHLANNRGPTARGRDW